MPGQLAAPKFGVAVVWESLGGHSGFAQWLQRGPRLYECRSRTARGRCAPPDAPARAAPEKPKPEEPPSRDRLPRRNRSVPHFFFFLLPLSSCLLHSIPPCRHFCFHFSAHYIVILPSSGIQRLDSGPLSSSFSSETLEYLPSLSRSSPRGTLKTDRFLVSMYHWRSSLYSAPRTADASNTLVRHAGTS